MQAKRYFLPLHSWILPLLVSPFDVFFWRAQRFLDPLVFISFQGAAAAAAGRGSPPPPGGRRASGVGFLLFRENDVEGARGGQGAGASTYGSPPAPRCGFSRHMAKMGGPWGVDMRLSLWYGHGSREVVLALKRGHDFERSPHGFCHGWQHGSPGTVKSCSRHSMGKVLWKWCPR